MAPKAGLIPSYFPSTKAPIEPSASTQAQSCSNTAAQSDAIPTQQEYTETDIGALIPGPQFVSLTGRIVNFFGQPVTSKLPLAAKGCMKMIVKDDTGSLSVRLYHADRDYGLRLGQLVMLRTSHVSNGTTTSLSCTSAPLFVSLFPERDKFCDFIIVDEGPHITDRCRIPLDYDRERPLPGLSTLQNYLDNEEDLGHCKLLLCVKSVGPRKTGKLIIQGFSLTTKWGTSLLVKADLFDDTATATLTLWGTAALSTASWLSFKTILLLSFPQCNKAHSRKAQLSLGRSSYLEIDPLIEAATWLRDFAAKVAIREHVNPGIQDSLFNVPAFLNSEKRVLYRLADIDELVRVAPAIPLIGFLSIVILEFNMVNLQARQMLCCTEHCSTPMYANTTNEVCSVCNSSIPLRLNPRIVGTVVDETGSVAAGRLIWTETAWNELLGRKSEEFVASSAELLGYMELRMACLRYTLVVGWAGDKVGRLCVLGVRM